MKSFIYTIGLIEPLFGNHRQTQPTNTTNTNGMRLISFAASRSPVVSSTSFPHRKIHKQTWASRDGVTKNQIDHVLTDQRHSSSVLDVRSCKGANIDSDHYLVRARLRCRISSSRPTNNNRQRKFNIDALSTPETAKRFEECITNPEARFYTRYPRHRKPLEQMR